MRLYRMVRAGELCVPLFYTQWTPSNYVQLVQSTVLDLSLQRMASQASQGILEQQQKGQEKRSAIREHLKNTMEKHAQMEMDGFYLKDKPFYVPKRRDGVLESIYNNWNLFRFNDIQKFDPNSFMEAVPRIFELVSQKIFQHEFSALKELIGAQVLSQIENNFPNFPEKVRQLLDLTETDLYCYHPVDRRSTSYYTGPAVRIAKLRLHKDGDNVYQSVLVVVTSIYKYSTLKDWPKMPCDYGFPLPRIVFANYYFTRIVKPVFDENWTIADLNYITV